MAMPRIIAVFFVARSVVGITISSGKVRSGVTPIEKVTTLLDDLKAEVESDGQAEANAYNEYSCFCKDSTKTKSDSITSGQDTINLLSADIAEKTATQANKASELQERKTTQGELAAELKATEERCAKEKADYEAKNADIEKAIRNLKTASDRMNAAKPQQASFLELDNHDLQRTLVLADALGLVKEPAQKEVGALDAFLQLHARQASSAGVDPVDPEFKYHSQGIIDTIDELHKEFTAEKANVDAEWAKTKKTCEDTIKSLQDEMSTNAAAIASLEGEIAELKVQISSARADLQNSENVLKDDQLYLTDLTAQCEQRAKDWDQRSQLRANELEALTKALTILKGNVTSADVSVNERAFIQEHRPRAAPSFLQKDASKALQRQRVERAVTLLQNEGRRLHSTVLGSLTAPRFDSTPAYDPFVKVKDLIQKLVERLIAESTAEATKKGFCDEEMGTATQDRDFRLEDANKLAVEITGLETKHDSLSEDISSLSTSLDGLRSDLANSTQIRADEKNANLATIKEAKEGLQALNDALAILKDFYKQAGKAEDFHAGRLQRRDAASLVQEKWSPVQEDTAGPGFDNAYSGKQEASTSIIGMLEVIKSDFERTIRTTEESEKQASIEHVNFDRVSNMDIGGKDTKKTLNAEDLDTTKNMIEQKMRDLQTSMDLLDSALVQLEELKPVCVDMTMPYAERVAKRDEEIAALKRALCILDTENVEEDCGK
jgi:phage shock protein A